jgi:hypothetical protein
MGQYKLWVDELKILEGGDRLWQGGRTILRGANKLWTDELKILEGGRTL